MYAYLIAAIIGLVALGAAGFQGYRLWADHVRAERAADDLANANEQAAKTKEIEERYRAKEQASATALAAIANDYEGKLTDAQRKTTMALDAIRSGAVRLRDPYAKTEACGSSAAEAVSSPGGRNGEKGSELSAEFGAFLYSEAARADAYTEQLAACQAVIAADRK